MKRRSRNHDVIMCWLRDLLCGALIGAGAILPGVSGGLHSREFQVCNEDDAIITPAKIMACTIIDLLADDAALAKKVVDEFQPRMTKDEYLAYLKEMTVDKTY